MAAFRSLAITILAFALTSGCFLNKKKKSGGDDAKSLVDNESIFFDRTGNGDTARLKFNTTSTVFCALEIYSQEKDVEPTAKDPLKATCSDGEDGKGQKEFVEKIKNLRTDMLYYVNILLYKNKDQKKPSERVTIKESPGNTGNVTADGKYEEILVARLNQPLKTAEFHRHGFSEPLAAAGLREKVTRKTGCSSGIPSDGSPFSKSASSIEINNLTTTDYGASKVGTHGDSTGRLKVAYSSLKTGIDRWSLLYEKDGKDIQVKALPGSYFHSVEIAKKSLGDPELSEIDSASTIDVDGGKDLEVKWTYERKTSSSTPSYVVVMVGQSESAESVRCIFDLASGGGSVPSGLLKPLGSDEFDIVVELETNQLWAKEGWLIAAYDWRLGKISLSQQ